MILRSPDPGSYVFNVSLEAVLDVRPSAEGEERADDKELFIAALKEAGFSIENSRLGSTYDVVRDLDRTYGNPGCFDWCCDDRVRKDVQVALLLPLLPNLRHLDMPSWFEPPYLRHIISVRKTAVLSSTSGCYHYGHPNEYAGARPIHEVESFFHLPSLIRFDGHKLMTDAEADPSSSSLSSIASRTSALKALAFCQCVLGIDVLDNHVWLSKELQSFHYSNDGGINLEHWRSFQEHFLSRRLNEMLLRHAKHSLLDLLLCIDASHLRCKDGLEEGPIGFLGEYKVLKLSLLRSSCWWADRMRT